MQYLLLSNKNVSNITLIEASLSDSNTAPALILKLSLPLNSVTQSNVSATGTGVAD